ncbi:IS66 family transposase, partial [Porphyromonas levii]
FEQASNEGDKRADDMLKQIGLLYTLEAQLKEEKAPPDKIHSERMRLAAPLLVAMEAWMKKVFLECTPKSTLGKAITYAHTVWIRIARYCTDGRYEIDNNGMERVMRYIAMGRN